MAMWVRAPVPGYHMDIGQFIHAQREAVEEDRGRERNRDRERRGDRDRSRERRNRRDRSDRRDDSRRGDRSDGDRHRHRDHDRGYRDQGYDDDYSDGTYSSYDRGYSGDKNESNYKDYDRSPQYDRGYYNDSIRHRSEKAADKWISETATDTVLVKGLPQHVDEKDIRAELMMSNTPVKEVRLVKYKQSGASRGFAFVEFQNVTDAQQWMEQNQGELRLLNQYTVRLYYSTPKNNSTIGNNLQQNQNSQQHLAQSAAGVIGDWICSKCGVHNFKRREHCFKCNISREESDRGKESDGYDQVGHNPCNTLILRGLDALTSEESLRVALSKVTLLSLKNLQVIRDEHGVSKSFAFLEMDSIACSTQLLDTIHRLQTPFEADGKAVMVNYAKNTFNTVMVTMNKQWGTQTQGQYADYASYEQYYNSEAYQQYYNEYYNQNTDASSTQTQANTTKSSAAVAQAAIQQAQAAKAFSQPENAQQQTLEQSQQQQPIQQTDLSEYPKYPTPDVSTYQYEETSGYYYDPVTGLYYDANTQYYYNSTTGEFMYWDGERQTYLPAPSDESQNMQRPGGETDKKEKGDRKDKVKVAKKIAKDMEKWAKTLNAQKDSQGTRRNFMPIGQQVQVRKENAAADAGFAMLEKFGKPELVKMNEAESNLMPPPPMPGSGNNAGGSSNPSGLVASYGGGDDSDQDDDDTVDESKLTDYSKMACLLCKRQFQTREALQRHQQMSDLHKKNLEELKKSKASARGAVQMNMGGDSSGQIQYRDRAKERREKYGAPAPPEPRSRDRMMREAPVPFEQPTSQGIGADNVGNKLLQKMGWNAGQGLGKSKQGIVDPLMASRRQQGAGLGSRGSKIMVDPAVSTDYRQAAKQQLFARYRELD